MIETIKRDFLQGLKNFKFWAEIISERVKIELNVLKIIAELNKLNEKRDELLKKIGKEVYDSFGKDINLSEDEKISFLMREIRELETQIESEKKRLSELEEMSRWRF